MVEQRLMNLAEQVNILSRVTELEKVGKKDEAWDLERTIPYDPWSAAFIKRYVGLNALLEADLNLAAVEQVYGKEWLAH